MREKIPGLINIEYSYMSGGPAELLFTHVFVGGEKILSFFSKVYYFLFLQHFHKLIKKQNQRKHVKFLSCFSARAFVLLRARFLWYFTFPVIIFQFTFFKLILL